MQIAKKSQVSAPELSLSINCGWYRNLCLHCQSYLVLPPTDRNFKEHICASGFPKLASKMNSFKYSKTCTFLGWSNYIKGISFGNAAIGVIDTVLENASPRTWIAHLQRCILLKKRKKTFCISPLIRFISTYLKRHFKVSKMF